MTSHPARSIDFLRFPREIRDKVYCLLLCSFDPVRTELDLGVLRRNECNRATHSIETAILGVNKQIHREAYDVMVKTNRFVHLNSAGAVPVKQLINAWATPVITMNRDSIERFPGFVLTVSLYLGAQMSMSKELLAMNAACNSVMLLGRDMDSFCKGLMDGDAYAPGFSKNLVMSLTIGPNLDPASPLKTSLSSFFTDLTQETLLLPFRTHLRGFKNVQIRGVVASHVSQAVIQDISQDEWADPQKVLEKVKAAKNLGNGHYRQRNFDQANIAWGDMALEVDRLLEGTSWKSVVERGGKSFLKQLAELYLTLQLNYAHVVISNMQSARHGSGFAMPVLAEMALDQAYRSIQKDYWKKGFAFTPTESLQAKLYYRQALFWRLEGKTERARAASTLINRALRLAPADASILAEQRLVKVWCSDVGIRN